MPPLMFGEWRPDVADYQQEHSKIITNVVARGDGYGPVRALQAFSAALPAACRGAFLATSPDGTVAMFAGTQTKLYKLDNTDLTWDEVSRTAALDTVLTVAGAPVTAHIGNLTAGGGLAAAFDGTSAQAAAACAVGSSNTTGYAGVTFAAPTPVRACKVYGSNDAGFITGADPTITLTLYGKTGSAPGSGTDGTVIGTLTPFSDSADESAGRTMVITDPYTNWDHVWIYIVQGGAAAVMNLAEVTLKGTDAYNVATKRQWQFAQFGTVVVAVNENDAPQAFTLGSSVAFAALAGSPPNAAFATVVANHLVLSGLLNNPDGIAWSALNDVTGWTPGTNGSDIQDFQDGGATMGIAGGEHGVVFQVDAIRRMAYVGGDTIFEFERISDGEGLAAPYSIITAGPRIFFLGTSGFQSITAGQYPVGISKERFTRTFIADWDTGSPHLMIGANEAETSRVWWFYKSKNGAAGIFNRAICYDWALERPSYIDGLSGEYVAVLAQPGVTLEGLDSNFGFTNIDIMAISLDDFAAASGQLLGVFGTDHKFGFLTGAALEAIMETPDYAFGKRFTIRAQRPITDSTTAFGSFTIRQRVADIPTYSGETAMNAIGLCPHHNDTRMARFRLRIPAGTDWSYANGVEPEAVTTGSQ